MPLAPETRLGPYEILAPLGAGGMGEVYRARDTRLGREVAVKVLPQDFTSSPQVRARFEREARTVSSLNHPHICVLYDIGREGDTDYLVMELVVGETIASRLAKGALSTTEVLNFGAQIAEALDSAHRAGVVHRDLKPGNVMLTKTGVKLMDFGLALDTGLAGPRRGVTSGATMTQSPAAGEPLTAKGMLVGTLPYMAPEQLEGKDTDARSDLWALGCMLYEMASGTRAFDSKSDAGLIAAILKEEPRPLPDLAPLSPPALAHVIDRCLAKDPGARWQSAGDVARELEWISRGDTRAGAVIEDRTKKRPVLRQRLALAIGIAGAVAAALLLIPKGAPQLNPNMRTRTVDVPMSDITYPGLSQDGRWIALPARDDHGVSGLYYMNASGGEVRPIAVDSSVIVTYADISPDGGQVVYGAALNPVVGEIRLVSALGGAVRTLAPYGAYPRWSPDGKRIGYLVPSFGSPKNMTEFWTVRPDGSERAMVFADSIPTPSGSISFAWSPDGKRIAWLRTFEHGSYSEIVIRDLVTGRERQLTHDRRFIDEMVWTKQDDIVFASNRGGASNLWIMRASGGRPAQITRGAGPDVGSRVSADGRTLLYLLKQPLESIGWWDVVSGEHGPVTREDQPFGAPCLPSPDGRSVVVPAPDDFLSGAQALVIMNRDGSGRRTLVPSGGGASHYSWSPDGRRIAWLREAVAPIESAYVHFVDVATGGSSARIALATRGTAWRFYWPSSDTLLVLDEHGSFQFSISANQASPRSPEQLFQCPPRGPGWSVMVDRRHGLPSAGLYLRFAKGDPDRRLMPVSWMRGDFGGKDFVYCWPESVGLSRMDLPSGRVTPVAHVPPDVRRSMLLYPTPDGRVVYWVDQKSASKLVIVENFRK